MQKYLNSRGLSILIGVLTGTALYIGHYAWHERNQGAEAVLVSFVVGAVGLALVWFGRQDIPRSERVNAFMAALPIPCFFVRAAAGFHRADILWVVYLIGLAFNSIAVYRIHRGDWSFGRVT